MAGTWQTLADLDLLGQFRVDNDVISAEWREFKFPTL